MACILCCSPKNVEDVPLNCVQVQMRNARIIPTQHLLPALSPGKRNSSSEALLYVSIPLCEVSIKLLSVSEACVWAALTASKEVDVVTGKGGEESEERFGLGLALLNGTCLFETKCNIFI